MTSDPGDVAAGLEGQKGRFGHIAEEALRLK